MHVDEMQNFDPGARSAARGHGALASHELLAAALPLQHAQNLDHTSGLSHSLTTWDLAMQHPANDSNRDVGGDEEGPVHHSSDMS